MNETTPSPLARVREAAAMLKAIHAGENLVRPGSRLSE
jgi:hypothetical protein